jgi:DNA-binding GntR family transcriptional regulator
MQTWQQHLQGLPARTPGVAMDPDVRARYAEAVYQAFKAGGTQYGIATYIGCSSRFVAHLLDLSEGLSDAPKAQLVATILQARIADGTYRAGCMIPSRNQLCVELGVPYSSLDRAIAWLTGQGITVSRPGRGTAVVDPDAPPTESAHQVRMPSGAVETWRPTGVRSRHIRDTVLARIWDGTYAEGSKIPILKVLVAEFDTTMGTVVHALKELKAQGILTSAKRHGTLVHPSARSRIASTVGNPDGTEALPPSHNSPCPRHPENRESPQGEA